MEGLTDDPELRIAMLQSEKLELQHQLAKLEKERVMEEKISELELQVKLMNDIIGKLRPKVDQLYEEYRSNLPWAD